MTNFFEHFKATLLSEFRFLKNFEFSDFEEKQIAYEYHFFAKSKKNIKIDFQIEMTSSTPIWTSLNGIYIENLFPEFDFFDEYRSELERIYNNIDNPKNVTNNQSAFLEKGFTLNNRYLKFIKSLLVDNPNYLENVSIYESLHQQQKLKFELENEVYLKDFKKLFDSNGHVLLTEAFLKEQFESKILTVETDKITVDFGSYDEFIEFEKIFSADTLNFETIFFKFEPK